MVEQRTQGAEDNPVHTHPALAHARHESPSHLRGAVEEGISCGGCAGNSDSHHDRGGLPGESEHRTHWHRDEHNHAELTHRHGYEAEEADEHDKEAHIH